MKSRLPAWLRALALLLALATPLSAAELNNSGSGQWSESDSSNTSASPDGWPSGLAPNQVRSVGQSMMGAIKRFWDRINATVTTTGSANAYVYTPTNNSFPTSLVSGERYSFVANFANTGTATLAINGLTAKNLFKQTPAGPAALAGGEIQANQIVDVVYDGTQFQIVSARPAGGFCQSASSSASLNFTTGITSSYSEYVLVLADIIPASDATELWLRISEDGGSTYKSGAGNYVHARFFTSSTPATGGTGGSDTKILITTTVSNNAVRGLSGEVHFWNPSSSATAKKFGWDLTFVGSDAVLYKMIGGGVYNADTNAINGVQLLMSSGNIASGKVCLVPVQ